jgi:hypothetical protein
MRAGPMDRDRKRFEPTLVDVSHPGRAMMGMIALRMGDSQPAEEIGNLRVLALLRPDDEVPMVAHQCIAENPQRHTLVGFGQHLFKRGKVGFLLEQPQLAIGSIEHMVNVAAENGTSAPWHAGKLSNHLQRVKNDSRPL